MLTFVTGSWLKHDIRLTANNDGRPDGSVFAMSTALAIFALLLALAVIGGCYVLHLQVKAMRSTIVDLEGRIGTLRPAAPVSPDLETTFDAGRRRLISIEILNPIELATSRVKMAAILGAMRPSLLNRVVYTQAVKQVSATLEAEGVVAEVRIHGAR